MGLFKCRKCGVVENTALTPKSWTQQDYPLCSECATGKWHGRFKKSKEMPEGEEDVFINK